MMKKRDILLAAGILAIALLAVLFLSQRKGYIKVETPGIELHLRGGLAGGATIRSGSRPVEVAARKYRPSYLEATAKHNGSTWKLQSHGPWGTLGKVLVAAGETTKIEAGPPLRIRPEVRSYRGRVSIGWAIYGRAGEKYRNIVWKDNRRVSAPQLRIIDRQGKVLASGRFRYG
jgi:hypothetical protein